MKAQLDAGHDTLTKFSTVIDSLSIVPYMFSNIKQKAVALRLGGRDVDVGLVAQGSASFALGKASYPNTLPYNVAQRYLPQVDVFLYQPPTDVMAVERSSEEVWANLFVLQCDKGTFKEVPDVTNVMYDYYKLRPIGRVKLECTVSSPEVGFDAITKVKGEATVLVRELTKTDATVSITYDFYVIVDADFFSVDAVSEVIPLVVIITTETSGNFAIILRAGGKHISTNIKGLYCGFLSSGAFAGWTKTHGAYANLSAESLWASSSILTITVNDPSMGTTDPIPDTYTKKTTDIVEIEAIPEVGYSVKNWEIDGTQYPSSETKSVKMYRNHAVTCVFWSATVILVRPNVNSPTIQHVPNAVGTNYQMVDEEYSDGDATCLLPASAQSRRWLDLFEFPDPSLPEGAIIDRVEVFARVRREMGKFDITARTALRTHDQTYYGSHVIPPTSYTLISTSYDVNPYTGEAWTVDEVNALQAGEDDESFFSITGSDEIRCTQVWVEVSYHVP